MTLSTAPAMQSHATVVHALPHRTRLRLPRSQGPQQMERAREALSHVSGVHNVEVSPSTNSLVVHHDEPTSQDELGEAIKNATGLALDVLPPRLQPDVEDEVSTVARSVHRTFVSLDNRVRKMTGGWLDLKMIVPVSLMGVAILRAGQEQGGASRVPPFILMYYAFDSYMKLHSSFREVEAAVSAEAGGGA